MAEGGRGKGEDEVCQRSLCGLGRDVGDHPRRNAAGIRFCIKGCSAGNHPRRNAAGIRVYAKVGGSGNHRGEGTRASAVEAASTVARCEPREIICGEEPAGIRGEV